MFQFGFNKLWSHLFYLLFCFLKFKCKVLLEDVEKVVNIIHLLYSGKFNPLLSLWKSIHLLFRDQYCSYFQSHVSPAVSLQVFFSNHSPPRLSIAQGPRLFHSSLMKSPPPELPCVFMRRFFLFVGPKHKQPMNQSERCGREGGRDISSMLVAGAQAA